jgi:hypothetical protein
MSESIRPPPLQLDYVSSKKFIIYLFNDWRIYHEL